MCFSEHVFPQETLNEIFNDHWPSSMTNMGVGAHFVSNVGLKHFFGTMTCPIRYDSNCFTFEYTTVVKCSLKWAKNASTAIGLS